jgi:hypothetical protein
MQRIECKLRIESSKGDLEISCVDQNNSYCERPP